MRLLLVEDDEMIGRAVLQALRAETYVVDWVRDGNTADTALAVGGHDLMLLDLGLPGRDGMEVLTRLRARRSRLPVLILTARDSVSNRIAGLDAGADDYLPKPFDLDELSARIRALLRRRAGHAQALLEHGDVSLDMTTREVSKAGQPVTLTIREFAVLQALMEHPRAVLTRDQLYQKLYGWGEEVGSNTLEVFIHGLRRKLGASFIVTIRGIGYCLTAATS